MLLQYTLFMMIETHEIKMQILDAIVIQQVRFKQTTQIEIIHFACFSKGQIIDTISELLADI